MLGYVRTANIIFPFRHQPRNSGTKQMAQMGNLAWILLENDIWWPGLLPDENKSLLNGRVSSSFRIVSLFGTDERVIVDLSMTSDIIRHNSHIDSNFFTLFSEQCVSDQFREKFSFALEEFNKYAAASKNDFQPPPDEKSNGNNSLQNDLVLTNQSLKRKDVLTWDDYFIAVAFLSAMRSKDPSTQVGACIVNNRNRIVGIGYNGFPRGCSDDILPWARSAEDELDTKYPVSC
jgi:hypothetical protein